MQLNPTTAELSLKSDVKSMLEKVKQQKGSFTLEIDANLQAKAELKQFRKDVAEMDKQVMDSLNTVGKISKKGNRFESGQDEDVEEATKYVNEVTPIMEALHRVLQALLCSAPQRDDEHDEVRQCAPDGHD